MRQAFLASIFGWLAGPALIWVFAIVEAGGVDPHDASPTLLFYAICVGMAAIPTCLLVAAPLLRFLPPASPLRKPWLAAIIGAAAGPAGLYLWVVVLSHRFFIPGVPHSMQDLIFPSTSSLVGATFAFSLAWMKRKEMKSP